MEFWLDFIDQTRSLKKMDINKLEKVCQNFLSELNPKWKSDPDMEETPIRLAKMYAHFFRNEDVIQYFEKKFPTQNRQMIVLKNIECFGMCPHHSPKEAVFNLL